MAAIIIISLGVGISGCMLGKNSINLPAFIDSAFTALPFFVCGYIFKKNTNILYPNKYDKYNWIFVLLCFSYIYYFGSRITYMKNDFHGTSIWIAYSGGIIGTLFIIFLSKIIKTLPLIRYYGRYSIIILVTHYQVCKIVKMAIQSINFGTYLSIASIFVITMFLELLVIELFFHMNYQQFCISCWHFLVQHDS